MRSFFHYMSPTYRGLQALGTIFLFCVLISLAGVGVSNAQNVLTIYIDPHGSDGHNGRTSKSAFATLQHALDVAYAYGSKSSGRTIRIEVSSGRYIGQAVKLSQPPPYTRFEIVASQNAKVKPEFDGAGTGKTWFVLQAKTQRKATFLFDGLAVSNYFTAMSFNGFREHPEAHLGGNTIQNMTFRRIGQIAAPDGPRSMAAVRFVNSRNNLIKNNEFIEIRNNNCDGLHALYLAHHSSGNRIVDNLFMHACGSPIRLRDNSNDNLASGNIFRDIRYQAIFDEWYCDPAKSKCTKRTPECPSWNNRYENNKVEGSNKTAMKSPTKVHVPKIVESCRTTRLNSAVSHMRKRISP